jgi:hypothetical protein
MFVSEVWFGGYIYLHVGHSGHQKQTSIFLALQAVCVHKYLDRTNRGHGYCDTDHLNITVLKHATLHRFNVNILLVALHEFLISIGYR